MNGTPVVVLVSLASALAFAISTNLKHSSAARVPALASMRPAALGRFVLATLRHPLWLLSILADLLGLSLQIVALHLGALAVVQPLLITGLLFTLMLRGLHRRRLSGAELLWAGVLVLSLAGFLLVAGIGSGGPPGEGVDRLPAAIAAATGIGVAASAVVIARRIRPAVTGAALLGVATGVIYAADAALLKETTDQAVRGIAHLLLHWQLYAVIVVGAAGLFVCQLAYHAGPLTASQPAIAAVDPLVSVVLGVLIFDERLRRGPWTGAALAVLVVLLAVAVLGLARQESADTDVAATPEVGEASRWGSNAEAAGPAD
ncbi:MAG: hypothetical protein QOK10_2265 [Pseudonocardiales bacterium]|jgi:drug/metabolite transporter (DMT)-like permease|nr:hypothetical protein [Pseudonocardiales bacterium]